MDTLCSVYIYYMYIQYKIVVFRQVVAPPGIVQSFVLLYIYIYNPVMFHLAGTVLNNTRLEQVYYIYLTPHFIS